MQPEDVIRILRAHRSELEEFRVASLSVFGSVARGEAGAESDVDLLVEFAEPVGLFEFVGLKQHLEDLLGCAVDLATPNALRPAMRPQILGEAVRAI